MPKKENQTQINGLLSPFLQRMRIKNAKPFFRGKRFLEIGASVGEIISHLPDGSEYIGIEGNPTYCENAKRNHPQHRFINLYLDKNNVKNLPIKTKFDTIIMLAVIEHVDEPTEILRGLAKYLSPEGVIIISTPNKIGDNILKLGSKIGIFMNEMDEHRELFTKERLYETTQSAGLEVIHHHFFEFKMNHLIVLGKTN